jgi:hypothetical protein
MVSEFYSCIFWCTLILVFTFVDAHIYFEAIIKIDKDDFIRRTFTVVSVPLRVALLKEFLTKTKDMYQWRGGRGWSGQDSQQETILFSKYQNVKPQSSKK